jgi:hypothetical protein
MLTLHLGTLQSGQSLSFEAWDPDGEEQFWSCRRAVEYLQSLSDERRREVRRVYLPGAMMAADDHDNLDYQDELVAALAGAVVAVDVAVLFVPDDLAAGGDERGYEYFSWRLHRGLIEAFRQGRLREVQFAHPRSYARGGAGGVGARAGSGSSGGGGRLAVWHYHNIGAHVERDLLGAEYGIILLHLRVDAHELEEQLPQAQRERLIEKVWAQAGFGLGEEEVAWEGGKGSRTVLIVRRLTQEELEGHRQCVVM